MCALPKGHELARKRVIRPKDLKDMPVMWSSRSTYQHQHIRAAFDSAGITPDVVLEASNSTAVRALVAQQVGAAIIDPVTARAGGADDIAIRRFAPSIPYELKLAYPANHARSDSVKAFADLVRRALDTY